MNLIQQLILIDEIKETIKKQTQRDLRLEEKEFLQVKLKVLSDQFDTKPELTPYIVKDIINTSFSVDLDKQIRETNLVWLRQIAHYICANEFHDYGLSTIGKIIGGKDHATVLHSIKTVRNRLDVNDYKFVEKYKKVCEKLGVKHNL